jgi:phosphoribosylformylglycinamidine (FGAM) synthase-like enzyme
VSQGGLLAALAEMAIGGRGAGDLGFTLDLEGLASFKLPPEKLLFSETGCYVVELSPVQEREILGVCARNRVNLARLGELKGRARLEIVQGRKSLAAWDVAELRDAHLSGCRSIFGIGKNGGERA